MAAIVVIVKAVKYGDHCRDCEGGEVWQPLSCGVVWRQGS